MASPIPSCALVLHQQLTNGSGHWIIIMIIYLASKHQTRRDCNERQLALSLAIIQTHLQPLLTYLQRRFLNFHSCSFAVLLWSWFERLANLIVTSALVLLWSHLVDIKPNVHRLSIAYMTHSVGGYFDLTLSPNSWLSCLVKRANQWSPSCRLASSSSNRR